MSHWADQFFGPLYGEIYRRYLLDNERTRTEADFARETLGLNKCQVLDLACGYGRHARILARHNRVIGLDKNLGYLQTAKSSAPAKHSANLNLVRGDMRSLPFATGSFDAVLLLFNSFGYFHQDPETLRSALDQPTPSRQVWKLPGVFYERNLVQPGFGEFNTTQPGTPNAQPGSTDATISPDPNLIVLQEIQRVLKKGGQLLLEVPNPAPLVSVVRKQPRRYMISSAFEIEEEYTLGPGDRYLLNKTRFRYRKQEEDGVYCLRLFQPSELRDLIRSAGLSTVKTYGNYEGGTFRASSSDTILIHARKR